MGGRHTTLELRFAEGAIERLPYLATVLVALKPAVIVAGSPAAALAARNVTRSIPIIMNSSENPMVLGLANSLAPPGGNVTGFWSGDEGLTGKRFELLKEAVPGGRALGSSKATTLRIRTRSNLCRQSLIHEVLAPARFEAAFATAASEKLQRLQISLDPLSVSHRAEFAALAANARLPNVVVRL